MDFIASFFLSQTRAKLLKLMFTNENKEFYLRELERETSMSIGAIQTEVKKLHALELIVTRKDGNRQYFKANTEHPLYHEIESIIRKSSGPHTVIKTVLSKFKEIEFAFIFGSYAKNEMTAKSDIDLFIIGNISSRTISEKLFDIKNKIGREVNEHVYSKETFKKSLATKRHFLLSLKETPKIFLKGSEADFEELYR